MAKKEKDKRMYFSHDSNSRNDPKIATIRSIYKYEGYGWYWALVEIIREESEYKLNIGKDIVYNGLAMQLQTDKDTMKQFIQDCIDIELFASDGEYIWSESLMRRMEQMEEKSAKARKSIEARWGKKKEEEKVNNNIVNIKENNVINAENNELMEISNFYLDNNFGMMSTTTGNEIISYLDDGIEKEVIIKALKESIDNNIFTWKYAKACLNKWLESGLKTVAEVEKHNEEYRNKRNKKNNIKLIPSTNSNKEDALSFIHRMAGVKQ
jgi:DnaD/phage-associated family protein